MHTCMHKFSKKILIYFSLGVFAFKDSISFIMSMNLHKLASDSKYFFFLFLCFTFDAYFKRVILFISC